MIVALGGLPFTGKSALARALAEAIPGVLLNTALLRKALFPTLVAVPPELNDWLYEGVLKAASWNLDTAPGTVIVLDGRPLTRHRDVLSLRRFASSLGHALHIVECVCPDKVASARSAAAGVPDLLPSAKDSGTDPIRSRRSWWTPASRWNSACRPPSTLCPVSQRAGWNPLPRGPCTRLDQVIGICSQL
ncbi:AAA family ATPase [Streptomyces sp. AC558_RSS880]|uniref:AAA family ATPase n=1 Tax=Streptomyces sp. AC558_RSS880 TaxID=2823687 RepID=UPI001C225C3C